MFRIIVVIAFILTSPIGYAKNIALVIGNQDYVSSGRLDTPINDATSIAARLRSIGFHVAKKENIRTRNEFLGILKKFANQSRSADIALIYYAGHSIEAWGEFYLLPTNARAIRSIQDLTTLVDYNDLETAVSGARLTGILSLDACRSNPLDNLRKQTNSRSIFSHGARHRGLPDIRGLRRTNQNPKPANLLTSFATAPKDTASDQYKNTKHSPYTLAFLQELKNPNREIGEFFRSLRSRVMQLTQNRQRPELHEERDARHILLYSKKYAKRTYLSAPNPRGKVRYLNGVSIDTGRY